MALTKATIREILSSAGVDAEHLTTATNRIVEGHVASIEALRDEIADKKEKIEELRKEAEKAESLEKQLKEAEDKLKDSKETAEKAEKYDQLQKEFDDYKAEQQKKATDAVKTEKFKELLKDVGLSEKGIQMALKWQGVDGVEIDDDGKITNAKDLKKSVKEDWGEYIETVKKDGANVSDPPNNTGGTKMTIEQIDAIQDAGERQKAMLENKELFGL